MTNVLTTFPALKVEIAFGYGPMDAAPAWTDVSAYVIGRVRIHRGRQRLLEQAQTGTCSLTLSNRDGRFSPWNTSSPHYLAGDGMQPGTPIRVTATYAAVTYPIWYGQVDSFG